MDEMRLLEEEEQKLFLDYVFSNRELFVTVCDIIQPEYFEPPYSSAVAFVKNYFFEHKQLPTLDFINARFKTFHEKSEVRLDEFEYITQTLETHCKLSAVRQAFEVSLEDFEKGNLGNIKKRFEDALLVSIQKELGTSQFADPRTRLIQMQENIDSRPIGIKPLDEMLEGVRRGEVVIFAAGSAGGKSITLANVGERMGRQKLDVLYITLELKEELTSKRMDSIITGIEAKAIFENIETVVNALKSVEQDYGHIDHKKFPSGATVNDFKAYIAEYHLRRGKYPDVVCLDYLDLMKPVDTSGKDGKFDMDKAITEEYRDFIGDINAYGFTASQLNRDSVGVEKITHAHIAGGLSKINTADAVVAIVAPTEEEEDTGIRVFQQLKIRNGERHPRPVTLYLNPKNLRLEETPKIQNTGATKDKLGLSKPSVPKSVTDIVKMN